MKANSKRLLSLSTIEEIGPDTSNTVTLGDYEVDKDKIIGLGAFSKVYRGKSKTGMDVCVKAINKYDKKKHHHKLAK